MRGMLRRFMQHYFFTESKAQILIAKELVDIIHNVDQRPAASGQLMWIVREVSRILKKLSALLFNSIQFTL
jgi:hypothetical protein